jgi:hypothetical protein
MRSTIKQKIVVPVSICITLLVSPFFALPRATSVEKPKVLYALVDTNFDAPTPPSTPFDPPILLAVNLEAQKGAVSGIDNGEFRVGVIGSTRAPASVSLAICPAGGEDGQGAVAYTVASIFSPKNQLAKLDLRTGAATLVGSPMVPELDIMAFACSPDGTLYAIGQLDPTNPAFNSLYKVDRETGLATLIGSTGVNNGNPSPPDPFSLSGFFMALAFAPDGTLYGVSDDGLGKGSTLYSISLKNGVATHVAHTNVDGVMGLAIDEDGKFYVTDYVPQSKIYTLDSVTGMATPILETHLDLVINIAFK